MTEAEWRTCTDPRDMIAWVADRAPARKPRLFACACCRQFGHLVTDGRSRRAVEVAERYADGREDEAALAAAREAAAEVWHKAEQAWKAGRAPLPQPAWVAQLATLAALQDPGSPAAVKDFLHLVSQTADNVVLFGEPDFPSAGPAVDAQWRHQGDLLRDLFGPLPFRPVALDPAWLRWRDGLVADLARSIDAAGRFEDLPVLADALEEAGCADRDVLDHCRARPPHVRGCWCLDLLLGRG